MDCDAGNLGFISGGTWLGVAHTGLKVLQLYIGRWLGVAHTGLEVLQLYIGRWLGVAHTGQWYFSFILVGSFGYQNRTKILQLYIGRWLGVSHTGQR